MSDQETASKFRRLAELRELRDSTKTASDNAEKDYRVYEREVFDEMEESPIQGSRRIDLGPPFGTITFTPRETKYGRIIDPDAAQEYFENRGMVEEFVHTDFSKKKLNELVRDLLEQGQPMPPGIDFYTNAGITISRKG